MIKYIFCWKIDSGWYLKTVIFWFSPFFFINRKDKLPFSIFLFFSIFHKILLEVVSHFELQLQLPIFWPTTFSWPYILWVKKVILLKNALNNSVTTQQYAPIVSQTAREVKNVTYTPVYTDLLHMILYHNNLRLNGYCLKYVLKILKISL